MKARSKQTLPKRFKKGAAKAPKASSSSQRQLGYAPVAMARGLGTGRIPAIRSNGIYTRIEHTEFFAPVTSAGTAFAVTSFACNPGVAGMFPWLSQVAQRYETYKFRDVRFCYHTRAATTQVGTVGMVFDFDAQDAAPISQMEALAYHDKGTDAPWKEISLRLDLAQGDRLPVRYVRAGLPANPYDLKTLDLGNLHVFTDGVAASDNLGLMEVIYTVDLYTPQIQDGVAGTSRSTTGLDATHLVGSDFAAYDADALLPVVAVSTSVLRFNQSFEGLVAFRAGGTGLGADLNLVSSASGAATVITQLANAGATISIGYFRVRAEPGTTWTPTITATTLTDLRFHFARGGFDQFS